MKAATYNPDTLNRIRAGASARELGWDAQFYSSVCRRHGIEPVRSTTTTPVVSDAASPPLAPASVKMVNAATEAAMILGLTKPTAPPSVPAPTVVHAAFFDAETFDVTRAGKTVHLAPRDFDRALVLAKLPTGCEGISSAAFAERIGASNSDLGKVYASRLRMLLRPLGITIPTNYRMASNYCLTDQVTGKRIVLASTKAGAST